MSSIKRSRVHVNYMNLLLFCGVPVGTDFVFR